MKSTDSSLSLLSLRIAKTKDRHWGVLATKDIRKGSIIFKMKGKIITSPTRTSVQIGKNKHIEDPISSYLNHHCEANAKVDRKLCALVSLRHIHKGEEITFNYNKNEDQMASPFICHCCGKYIMGKKIKFPSLINLKKKLKQLKLVPIG